MTSIFCKMAFLGVFILIQAGFSANSFAIPVEVANAPDDNLNLTVSAIQSAQQTLNLNIYELDSPEIVDALLARIVAGVKVQILEEGSPVGGLSTAEVGVQGQLVQAMNGKAGDHFFEMKKGTSARRYHFDHAKYAVIDGNTLLIGSENYSPTGNPVPGTIGNRGWEVVIHDSEISNEYSSIFATDADPSAGDVKELTSNQRSESAFSENLRASALPASIYLKVPAMVAQSLDASQILRATSPDTSLTRVVAAINQATSSIDIQQMTLASTWKGAATSPVIDAIVAAAKRGVKVRVLLNDDAVFDHPSSGKPPVHPNSVTAAQLNQTASQNNLSLVATIANVKAMGVDYIHNKGMLIDGNLTLVSSINWDENSFQNNREAAVLMTSPTIYQYYEGLFEKDWQASGGQADFAQSFHFSPAICPQSLHVSIQVKTLQVSDQDDSDFKSLENLKVDEDFIVQKSDENCVLVDHDGAKIEDKSFLQIKTSAQGVTSLVYEGYTPTASKLFSIRSKLDSPNAILGSHSSEIYDGSGPGREMIGTAVMVLSIPAQ